MIWRIQDLCGAGQKNHIKTYQNIQTLKTSDSLGVGVLLESMMFLSKGQKIHIRLLAIVWNDWAPKMDLRIDAKIFINLAVPLVP